MCGNTRPAIRRAARFGDSWNPFGIGLHDFTAGVASPRALTQGRPFATVAAHLRIRIDPSGGPDALMAGSVDAVTAVLQRYRRAVDDLLRQMRVMAEQIRPALAG